MREKIKSAFLSREFIVFVFIGGINVFNGIFFAFLFSLFLNANLAFICGYAISLTISYLLNNKFVFREVISIKKYIKFCISYIPNFIIQNLCVFLFFNMLYFDKLLAYAIAAIIGVPITFLLLKFYVFAKK